MRKDIQKIILVFLATVVVVYGLPRLGIPHIFIQAIFAALIVKIYRSRDDLFWLVWYFVVENSPGRLFMGGRAENIYRLPMFSLAPGLALKFGEIVLLVFIIKSLQKRTPANSVFTRQVWTLIFLGVVYFVLSFIIGISPQNIVPTVRLILPWTWLLIVPRYIRTREDLKRVFHMLIPLTILAFVALIQSYATGMYLRSMLSGSRALRTIDAQDRLARVYSAEYLTYYSLIISLYFLALKRHTLNPNVLILTAFLASLGVFISGTRGWIIALMILYASFFFISGFGMFKQLIRTIVIVSLLGLIITSLFPIISSQGQLALQRFMTMEDLARGDLTAGGTLSRLTDKTPRVMDAFKGSPIIGWAFSDTYHDFADGHVAHPTNLLNLGIIGFIILNYTYLVICFKTYWLGRRPEYYRTNSNAATVFFLALIGLFVAHSSSGSLWGFASSSEPICIMWAFLFASINAELNPYMPRDLAGAHQVIQT